jgi:hypothetical protein
LLLCLLAVVRIEQSCPLCDGIVPEARSGFIATASGVLVPKFQEKSDPALNAKEPLVLSPVYVVRNRKQVIARANRHIASGQGSNGTPGEFKWRGAYPHEMIDDHIYRETFAGIGENGHPNNSGCTIFSVFSLKFWKAGILESNIDVGGLVALHRVKLALHNAQLTLEYQGSYDAYRYQSGSEPTYTGRPVRNPPFINLVWGFVFLAMTMLSVFMSQKSAEYADKRHWLAPWW